jgi:hypothetical protein
LDHKGVPVRIAMRISSKIKILSCAVGAIR